jgi:RNA polymerase sigma-70 factor (ECF subfamily)
MAHMRARGSTASDEEVETLARLRAGDERAFEALVTRHSATMLAVAQTYVRTRAVAEEVVQEAWLGVLQSLERFEGRSSLTTWVLAILVNKAKTRAVREGRTLLLASLAGGDAGPAVDPARFRGPEDPYPGHWRSFPAEWGASADVAAEDHETLRVAMSAIAALPPAQRTVIVLRDVEGYGADEVCHLLDVSPGNQRVLLHRARSRVRDALDRHLAG